MTSDIQVGNESNTVRSEIYSANAQASIVLAAVAFAAGPVIGNIKTIMHQAWPITGLVAAGSAAVVGAVWSLLDVVLPRLDASGHGSFLSWSKCDRAAIRKALGEDYQLNELLVLSRIAAAKYRCLRRAGRLLKFALVVLASAAILNLIY
jgi:pycsar effector protein